MHSSDEYGVLRWPLIEIASVANVPAKLLRELAERNVLKGAEAGAVDYVYTPRHSGKEGTSVILVVGGNGPCWYCSRLVRDAWIRRRRGESSQFELPNTVPKEPPKLTPIPPIGTTLDDPPMPPLKHGPAVAVAVAVKSFGTNLTVSTAGDPLPAPGPDEPPKPPAVDLSAPLDPVKDEIWRTARTILEAQGVPMDAARPFLGKLCRDYGTLLVLDAVRDCALATPAEAKGWLVARCQERRAQSGNKSAAIEQRNRTAVEAALREANRGRV